MTSMRRRLLVSLLTMFVLAWVLFGAMTYYSSYHEVEELFDAHLAQSARVLLGLTLHEVEEEEGRDTAIDILGQERGHRYEERIAFQIWRAGRLLLRSPNAPADSMSSEPGYSDQVIGDAVWRVFVLDDLEHAVVVQVGERDELRKSLIYGILRDALFPALVALPVLAILIWNGVGRSTSALRGVAGEVAARSPSQLHPLDLSDLPDEIQPLATSLNALLARLANALEGEQRFTANASHELRTPLAALKAQAQVAQRATREPERRKALQQIVTGVDRATHLVEQLLTLARLDPEAVGMHATLDLADLATDVVAQLAPAAAAKQVELNTHAGTGVIVAAHQEFLAIMLRNLVDNAVRYTPAGGHVSVCVRHTDAGAELTVEDDGPGIPESERGYVLERFYRGAGGNHAPGCGLGLSIAQRIAELHGTRIELLTPRTGRGLLVRVWLPLVGARVLVTS